MTKTLKVYGWTGINPDYTNGLGVQVRFICAAHSVAELLRITGIRRSEYAWDGCETGNQEEVRQASENYGYAWYGPLNYSASKKWIRYS